MIRLGINGFGRTGRTAARIALNNSKVKLVAINSRADIASHAYLLKYDSIYKTFDREVKVDGNSLRIDQDKIDVYQEESPKEIPWHKSKVDIVLECTGKFKTTATAGKHLGKTVKQVIISAPAKDESTPTLNLGVNEADFRKEMRVVSMASCTTNCLTVTCKVLDEEFVIKRGVMTTIHSPTDSQNLLDNSNKKVRLRRCSPLSIIPDSTGASKSLARVLPQLKGKFACQSLRVPSFSGSLIDLAVEVKKSTFAEEVNEAFRKKSRSSLKGILEVAEDEIVGVDIQGNSHSAILDPFLTAVIDRTLVKVFAWYDNEWGYSSRLIDLAVYVAEQLKVITDA